MLYFSPGEMGVRARLSQAVVASFIALVIGVVSSIYVVRFAIQNTKNGMTYASTVASVLNTVQIQIFNMIYMNIAVRLTDLENHRTDTGEFLMCATFYQSCNFLLMLLYLYWYDWLIE